MNALPLSPIAQIVMDAASAGSPYIVPYTNQKIAAGTIRAAAKLVAEMRPTGGRAWTLEQATSYAVLTEATNMLLSIATELENH